MRTFPCEIEGAAIVVVGNFNPSIFHPAWFEQQGILSKAQAASATVQAVIPDVAQFTVGSDKIEIQALRDRFTVTGPADSQMELPAIVNQTLGFLEHTPVKLLGINYNMHFRMPSAETWHQVGHRLAPKEMWEGLLETPGTRRVAVQGHRPGSRARNVTVTVEPSVQVPNGVFIGTNEHYDLGVDSPVATLVDILGSEWQASVEFARRLGKTLLERATE